MAEDVLNASTVCTAVLEVCAAQLAECERAAVDSYVAAGIIAWDNCCGLLVTAPERVYRTGSFPTEGPDPNGCFDGLIAVNVVVLLLRCVPVLNDKGAPPTPAELNAAYGEVLIDAAIIWNTLESFVGYETANLSQTFVGAEGGCIGVETRITVGVDGERWCGACGGAEVEP